MPGRPPEGGKRGFLTPATPGPPPSPETTGNPVFNSPWSYLGVPTVSLPVAWMADGLPLAIQLVGAEMKDLRVLYSAALTERAVGFDRRPVPG